MRLKTLIIAACSVGFLSSVAVAQDQAPADKEGQTKMSVPTGGMQKKKMMRHRKHHRMHKKMM